MRRKLGSKDDLWAEVKTAMSAMDTLKKQELRNQARMVEDMKPCPVCKRGVTTSQVCGRDTISMCETYFNELKRQAVSPPPGKPLDRMCGYAVDVFPCDPRQL
jgi:hypothetical protein